MFSKTAAMMRSHSASFKSRPKNRTRTPKYHHRSTATLLDGSSHSDIENNTRERRSRSHSSRSVSDNNIFFHHHQHHHNFYIPRITSSSSSSSATTTNNISNTSSILGNAAGGGCEIKKFLIYAILFFAAYYLLFVAITTTYRHNVYSKKIRTPNIPNRVDIVTSKHTNPQQIQIEAEAKPQPQPQPQHIHVNPLQQLNALKTNQNSAQTETKTKTLDVESVAAQPHKSSVIAERRRRRKRHRQEVRKLKPFAQMYLSDNPYYLDSNLVIIGQVCDAEKRIDMILYQLESISCLFNSTTFILFESNSKDKTLLHLQRWSLRKALNCTQIAFKPENKKKYHEIKTLNELISIYKPIKYNHDYIYDYDNIDSMIANYLETKYVTIADINVYQISEYLSNKLRADDHELKEIEIEEILYDKLQAIKYVRYHQEISAHENKMFKNILSGDEMVKDELIIEEEILRQLRVYGSLNELHNGYNVMETTEIEEEEEESDVSISDSSNGDGEISVIFMDEKIGANELDVEYGFMQGIKREELKRHSHSDFVQEFGGIHDELEGLIQYDETIIHEKLRERKRKYEERRRKERAKREEEILRSQNLMDAINKRMNQNKEKIHTKNNENEKENINTKAEELLEMMQQEQEEEKHETTESPPKFREKLFRIERFVIYRNMLLNMTQLLSRELNINFDYMLAIDMDIYSIDVRTFMNELYFMPHNLNGLCIDGIDWMGYTRDTFATVKTNGGWLHYGHDALIDNTKYIYDNQHAMYQRTKVPNDANRFEEVKSCFGGIMIYKNPNNHLFNQKCRYTLTRDIFYTNYNNTQQLSEIRDDDDDDSYETKQLFNYTYLYWLTNRYHNDYSEQSKLEIKLFIKQYVELLQVFEKTVENRELIPTDGDICEHIPYHYCLWDKGFKFAISSRAKLYYDKFYPINRNDTNWANYIANRAKFTL